MNENTKVCLWKDIAKELRKKGLSYEDVAVFTGKTYSIIARFCIDNGLTYKDLKQRQPYTVSEKVKEAANCRDISYLHEKRGPSEKTKAIIFLRRQRKTYEEIMAILGVTYKSVQNVCNSYNVAYCDIEEKWKDSVEDLRRQGKTYSDIALEFGVDKETVEHFCQRRGLRYSDLGQKQPRNNKDPWNKRKTLTDWNKRCFDLTGGKFELIDHELLPSGEQRLLVRCVKCGSKKEISSISLRSGGIKCTPCQKEHTRRRHESDKQIREWKKNYERGRVLVQMEMSFCKCGRLLPFGRMVCDECKRKTARQRERRTEQKRRLRAQAEFDKSITLEKLYERDHGVCYLCNKTCDWSDFQRINGNFIVGGSYPTVEHVKALCHGGTHTWDNVKLACHACNSKKGTKKIETIAR